MLTDSPLFSFFAMPHYDYRCTTCSHTFEVFQKMTDPKLSDCPQEGCAGSVVRLLGTGAGVVFKGSGFYQTDYRKDSYQKEAAKDKPTSQQPSKKTSSSSAKKNPT